MIEEEKLMKVIEVMVKPLTTPDGCGRFDSEIQAYNEGLIDAMEKVNEQPKVGEWIPCSEPPKYTDDYLVTVGINRDGFGMYDEVRIANYNTVYGKWIVHEDWENAIVTNPIAWMPLPGPYKGK